MGKISKVPAKGCLYVVATPIGNLADFSGRGREILAGADCIAAEDTRHSSKLLAHFGIKRPMLAYHDHSNVRIREKLLKLVRDGASVALISDAGTPLISDPGYALVKAAREEGIRVLPVPGPSALIAALCVSGLPTDRFRFAGFLPSGTAARRRRLEELESEPITSVLYESSHRVLDCLDDMIAVLGAARRIFIAREMTKQFESHFLGSLEEAAAWLRGDANERKGEFVLVLAGHETSSEQDERLAEALRIVTLLKGDLPLKKAAAIASKITGVRKNVIYGAALEKS